MQDVGVSMNLVFSFLGIIVMHERNRIMNQVWNPPPLGSFKLNFDGARILSSGLAFSIAVARDEYDRWMWGIGRNIGRCSIEKTKLWAIYDVLRVA
ncbi:hypothetical protein J1N35_035644 [Gossypium stocksii]|uniref:RNase H type-1 domain-containing protein n=1 Tax=Gossypium stocksii TaxID=47602 RepID=A0A9D3ZR53_9ROSI|nr:hypothetical protein J1N35_035644 [Gossypium stocksii]